MDEGFRAHRTHLSDVFHRNMLLMEAKKRRVLPMDVFSLLPMQQCNMRSSFAFFLDDPTSFPVPLESEFSHGLRHFACAIQSYVVGVVFPVVFQGIASVTFERWQLHLDAYSFDIPLPRSFPNVACT